MQRQGEHGISVLGILIAMAVLAAMGTGMAVMVTTNQEVRSQQVYSAQSFASAQAGLELALGLEADNANPCDPFSRQLLGDSLLGNSITINRVNNRIYVTGTKGSGSSSVSIVDPYPPNSAQMLTIDTSNAKDASNGAPPKKLIGVTFQLAPGCGNPVTITSMVVSWSPEDDEEIMQIKFDGNNIYNTPGNDGKESGETINTSDVTISDANVHNMDFIRWDDDIQNRLYTLKFNFADGSNKTVTVDTR